MDVSKLHFKRQSRVGEHYCDGSMTVAWAHLPVSSWTGVHRRGAQLPHLWAGPNVCPQAGTSEIHVSGVTIYVPTAHALCSWASGFQLGATTPSPETSGNYLETSLVASQRMVLLASNRQRPGMLLDILQPTGQPHTTAETITSKCH